MRALVYDGKKASVEAQRAEPEVPKGEALIRPLRLGICSTDLEICRGYTDFRGVLGHEFVGVVEKVSRPGDKKWLDKRVVGSINCVCGKCDMCRGGLPEHCRKRTVLGISGRDGCFAERFTLPVPNLFEVPATLDDDHAVFTEPVAAAYQILRQITIEGRPYVTVLGDGRLGLICAQVMSQLNATVRLVGKHPEKLALCEKWKVKHRLLAEVGLRADQDIVVDCTGSAEGLAVAMKMVRPRGKIVLKTTASVSAGKTGTVPAAIDMSPLVVNEVQVIGSRCGPMAEALWALANGKVDVVSLISRRVKLADGVEAMRMARSGGVVKVLMEP